MAGVLGRAMVEVFADLSKFTPGLKQRIKAALDEQTKDLRFNELDKSAEKAGESAADELAKGVDRKIEKDMDKEGRKGGNSLMKGLSRGFSAAATAFLPVLISLAVELVAALAPAATALGATLPAAMTTAIAGAFTLKLAFDNVGKALTTAFDPKKAKQFEAAMAKLAPAARSFVNEVRNLHPAFHQLQQDVQQVFFTQLQGTLTRVARTLLPTLHSGLTGLSQDLGRMANGLLGVFGNRRQDIASIFVSARAAIQPFIPALAALAGTFLTLARAGGPLLTSLSGGLAHLLVMFSQFIARAASSGALSQFFSDALVVLRQVGALIHSVFDLVTSLISALQADGAQALGFLTTLIAQLAAFFRTPAGQEMLAQVFRLLNTALSTMQQVLTPLLPAIGQLTGIFAGGLADALVKITPLLVSIADAMAKYPGLIVAAVAAWGAYRLALIAVAVYEALVDALNPVGWIILAVTAIAAGAYLIYKNWSAVEAALKSAWGAISDFFKGVWHWITGVGSDIAHWFTVTLPNFFNRLPDIIGGAFRRAFDWARREVREGADAVVGFVRALPGRISGFMRNVGHDILAGLKSGINSVISSFNYGIGLVSAAIHIGLPRLPLLASGGLVNAPTLAVVGEAGPEAVIPMSDPSRAAAVAKSTGLLDILGSRMSNVGTTLVKVYLGTREITDILDVRIDKKLGEQADELAYGTR